MLEIAPSALRAVRNKEGDVKQRGAINDDYFDFWATVCATPSVTHAVGAQSVAALVPLIEIEPERFRV
jgi:hypothetical protein